MIQSHERCITQLQRLKDYWYGLVQSKFPASHFKNQPPHSSQPNDSGRWLAEIGLRPDDDLPRMAKSRKMTYREWPNPERWLTENGQIPEDNLLRLTKSRHFSGIIETSDLWKSKTNKYFLPYFSVNIGNSKPLPPLSIVRGIYGR